MRPTIAFALLVGVLVSGCAGPEPAAPQGEPASSTAPPAVTLPTWEVGRYWTYDSPQIGRYSHVVTADQGVDWLMESDNEANAFFAAWGDVSSLGAIRKSDLAGSQEAGRVEFFRWPLTAGATWTTTWDGVTRRITVTDVADGEATLEAREDDRLVVRYAIDQEGGWFTSFDFHDEAGATVFSARRVTHGTGFSGEVLRYRLAVAFEGQGTIGAAPVVIGGAFDVPADITDIWVDIAIDCPSGAYGYSIGQAAEPAWSSQGQCPAHTTQRGVIATAPPEGEWNQGLIATSPQGEGAYAITVLLRTLERARLSA